MTPSTFEESGVHFRRRNGVAHDLLVPQKVPMHRTRDDVRHVRHLKLDERVALRARRTLRAREAQPPNFPKLREEAAHLCLVKAVRNVSQIDDGRRLVALFAAVRRTLPLLPGRVFFQRCRCGGGRLSEGRVDGRQRDELGVGVALLFFAV